MVLRPLLTFHKNLTLRVHRWMFCDLLLLACLVFRTFRMLSLSVILPPLLLAVQVSLLRLLVSRIGPEQLMDLHLTFGSISLLLLLDFKKTEILLVLG